MVYRRLVEAFWVGGCPSRLNHARLSLFSPKSLIFYAKSLICVWVVLVARVFYPSLYIYFF